MPYEQIVSLVAVSIIAALFSLLVDALLVRFDRRLVFLLPAILFALTGFLAVFTFSGAAGWAVIILAGIVVMSAMAFAISFIVGLLFYLKHPQTKAEARRRKQ